MINKIKEYREEKQLTQAELAEKADVSRAILSGLESGRITNTTSDTLIKISVALGVSVKELFFE